MATETSGSDPVTERDPYVSVLRRWPTDDGQWKVSEEGANAVGVGETPQDALVDYVQQHVPEGAWD